MNDKLKRREFVKRSLTAAGAGVVLANRNVHARVLGANDRISVGMIGVGGRGSDLMRWVLEIAKEKNNVQIAGVSDVKVTARPEVAVAATVKSASPSRRSGSGANVIVCSIGTGFTVNERVTCGAGE